MADLFSNGKGASHALLLAFVDAMIAIAGAGRDPVYWGFLTLLAGVPFYVLIRWRLPSQG